MTIKCDKCIKRKEIGLGICNECRKAKQDEYKALIKIVRKGV